ncbi:LysR family transcriptional regulator [Pseudoalteromonas denitrificans]|uniref:DNA-binding transcriptional regulator, LysR family n=1 Tax=Pseudoalteromonas denitrificans DSM 6059 TaxID=1123010 RepID=A0A1I1U7L2_9GAMM|nr:LysR family transcriptional regulator [Pseudoalteromonas denitrificans]SFD66812.1 DNA-binding transcriptional regulator, LysR family [Pseudoalteromonas denitrificans DSM 6059]
MIDWDDIRFFLAVAQNGNVTAAARALNVNHSTVSRRIAALEEKHGVRLFERIPSGYEMTSAAEDIYQLALELEAKNQQISRRLFGQDSRLQGEINLTMPHDIFEYSLVNDFADFKEQQPKIQLNLCVGQGLKNLAAREADIAIRLTPAPPDYLIGKKIAQIQHGIYQSIKLEKSNSIPIIAWQNETQVPDWAKIHFENAHIAIRVDDLYAMYCAVKAGIGIARMPCYLPDTIANESVKRLPINIPLSNWGVWVLSHVDLRHTRRVRCCKDFLTERLIHKKTYFEGHRSHY